MIENLKIKKKLMSLGITTVALVNGAIGLNCAEAQVNEKEMQSIVSMMQNEEVTPVPTEIPQVTPTPSDPYTLTDEEAIEMGTYIYENYAKKLAAVEGTTFYGHREYYQKEDMINYVCLFNQKYPTIYADRTSSLEYGDIVWVNTVLEDFLIGRKQYRSFSDEVNIFPYSLFLKEGRPEKALLEELENDFAYLSNNKVTDEEIYEYWGKVFKLAINADETFKDWHEFDFQLFYYTAKSQFYFMEEHPRFYNNFDLLVPAKYVFGGNKDAKLNIFDAFGMRYSIRRNKYPGLTNQEFNAYAGCLEELYDKYGIINRDNNYILQRINGSN